jgi:ankyrin repeat protein
LTESQWEVLMMGCEDEVRAAVLGGLDLDRLGPSTHAPAICALVGVSPFDRLRLLIELGADVDAVDAGGDTACIRAAKDGHLEALTILRGSGASLDVRGRHGRTALMAACAGGHLACATQLLASGAAVETVDGKGRDALSHAAMAGSGACIDLLLGAGVLPLAVDTLGRAPSYYAMQFNFPHLAARLRAIEAAVREREVLEGETEAADASRSPRRV